MGGQQIGPRYKDYNNFKVMRTFFSVALTAAICSAQEAEKAESKPDIELGYTAASPEMEVRRLGEELDFMHHHDHHAPTEFVHDMSILPVHFTHDPMHTAQAGLVHGFDGHAHHIASEHFYEEEMMHHPEFSHHDHHHVIHSAEQPPAFAPSAFDERYEHHDRMMFEEPYPKYHAHGSHHTHHSDYDEYAHLAQRHLPSTIRDLLGIGEDGKALQPEE